MAGKRLTFPAKLRDAFGDEVFDEMNAAERQEPISRAVASLSGPYRDRAVALFEDFRARAKPDAPATSKALIMLIAAHYLAAAHALTASKDRDRVDAFVSLWAERDLRSLSLLVRFLAKISGREEREAREALEAGLKEHLAAERGEQESDDTTGGTPMPEQPGEEEVRTSILEEALALFAFDESRLPERLHYRVDPTTGERTLSSGQIALIEDTLAAVQKLNGAPKDTHAVLGILLMDGHHDPDDFSFFKFVKAAMDELESSVGERQVAGDGRFDPGFQLKRHVFDRVRIELTDDGETSGIFYDAMANVSRSMVDKFDSVPPGSPGFSRTVRAHYDEETLRAGGGDGGGGSGVAFLDLPPLSDPNDGAGDIVPKNVEAISAMYVVYQCSQMMVFAVTNRVVDLFMAGLLPMQGDSTARALDNWYWKRHSMVSAQGMMNNFSRALGAPGGDVGGDVTPNTEFNTLLIRVISSISEYERQNSLGQLIDQTPGRARPHSGEYVRKAVRDLAANATLYGYAGAQFAAERMVRQLREAMEILQLPRVREIYGVSTMWQVIERVAQSEFGTTVNIVKHRTLAEEVRKIFEVVADRAEVWSRSSAQPLFSDSFASEEFGSRSGLTPDLNTEDTQKLFRAAQYFLAVNGVQGDQVYEYSQPADTPALPSIPGMSAFGNQGAVGMPDMSGGGLADMANQRVDELLAGSGISRPGTA